MAAPTIASRTEWRHILSAAPAAVHWAWDHTLPQTSITMNIQLCEERKKLCLEAAERLSSPQWANFAQEWNDWITFFTNLRKEYQQ